MEKEKSATKFLAQKVLLMPLISGLQISSSCAFYVEAIIYTDVQVSNVGASATSI